MLDRRDADFTFKGRCGEAVVLRFVSTLSRLPFVRALGRQIKGDRTASVPTCSGRRAMRFPSCLASSP